VAAEKGSDGVRKGMNVGGLKETNPQRNETDEEVRPLGSVGEERQLVRGMEDCGEMYVKVKSEVLKEFRSPYGPGGKYVYTKVGRERFVYQFVRDPEAPVEPTPEPGPRVEDSWR
jgi:hypothetical protein